MPHKLRRIRQRTLRAPPLEYRQPLRVARPLLREDKTRSKNHNLNCTLARAARFCLIAQSKANFFFPMNPDLHIQERCQRDFQPWRSKRSPSLRVLNEAYLYPTPHIAQFTSAP